MPSGQRIRANNIYGTIQNNPLAIADVSITSQGLQKLPPISGQHAVIVLDPKRVYGEPEIVVVTSHLSSGSTATVLRGQYGTTARQHPSETAWAHVPIDEDFIEILTAGSRPSNPYEGQLIYETDTDYFMGHNGTSWENALKLGQWIDWTPTLSQGASTNIAKTVGYARYVKIGRTVVANYYLTVTGTGTAAASVAVSLPININPTQAPFASMIGGGIFVYDSSASTYYFGLAANAGTADRAFAHPLTSIGLGSQFLGIGSTAGTALFNAALASNDVVTGTLLYEALS